MSWMIVRTIEKKDRGAAWWGALGGLCAGAAAVALRDKRRRAGLEQKATHLAHELLGAGHVLGQDVRNRSRGLWAELAGRLHQEHPGDEVIEARVRARLGRVCRHPGAIQCQARGGEVLLSGPVLEPEARPVVAAIARVKGVRRVIDHLARHTSTDHVPALQGGVAHWAADRRSWSPSWRLLAASGGAGLASWGFARWGLGGGSVGMLGCALTLRALSNLSPRSLLGIGAGRRAVDIDKAIHIDAPPDQVFAYFRAFENFPRFMTHVAQVRTAGDGRSHWMVTGPAGTRFEWDAEITSLVPNQVLAWRSVEGTSVNQSGAIHFQPEGSGTRVMIRLTYNPPGGAIGHGFAKVLRADPKKLMDDDLLRLKSLLERGKARGRHGQVTREELPV
ncbi:MAG: SRPBCC family protein [Myxococcales bacterium]